MAINIDKHTYHAGRLTRMLKIRFDNLLITTTNLRLQTLTTAVLVLLATVASLFKQVWMRQFFSCDKVTCIGVRGFGMWWCGLAVFPTAQLSIPSAAMNARATTRVLTRVLLPARSYPRALLPARSYLRLPLIRLIGLLSRGSRVYTVTYVKSLLLFIRNFMTNTVLIRKVFCEN